MRSRPDVKVMLTPSHGVAGERLTAETILDVKTETPIDAVTMTLTGTLRTGAGKGVQYTTIFQKAWHSQADTLQPGERRYRVAFDLPADLPASYPGAYGDVSYTLAVHVSIPWWPDRRASFVVPVITPPVMNRAPRPGNYATSSAGPRGTDPYVELALDNTWLAPGDVLTGSFSFANLGSRNVRGVAIAFVETERLYYTHESRRFTVRVLDVAPTDGASYPFRVYVPPHITPSFRCQGFSVTTHVEVRADVAWGSDVVLPVDVAVVRGEALRQTQSWIAPVGRERRAIVWRATAQKLGLLADPDEEKMSAVRGLVGIDIHTEQREADFWLVAQLAWPSLGLDLQVRDRVWSDTYSMDKVVLGDIGAHVAVHAREHAQAKAILTPELLSSLRLFETVALDDQRATLAVRGSVHTTEHTERFVRAVVAVADALNRVHGLVPVPTMFARYEAAWRAFAERVFGRFEPGGMVVHDGRVGTDRFTLGATWRQNGLLLGTTLTVVVDPPLQEPPTSVDDPRVSPAARDLWRELAKQARSIAVRPDAIVVELAGAVNDPSERMPLVELAVAFRRALAGQVAAGPFR